MAESKRRLTFCVNVFPLLPVRHYIAEILPIRLKTLSYQSVYVLRETRSAWGASAAWPVSHHLSMWWIHQGQGQILQNISILFYQCYILTSNLFRSVRAKVFQQRRFVTLLSSYLHVGLNLPNWNRRRRLFVNPHSMTDKLTRFNDLPTPRHVVKTYLAPFTRTAQFFANKSPSENPLTGSNKKWPNSESSSHSMTFRGSIASDLWVWFMHPMSFGRTRTHKNRTRDKYDLPEGSKCLGA